MPNRMKEPHATKKLRKLESGRFQARVTYWDPETGKRRETTGTFATEREAKKWKTEQEMRFRQDPSPKASSRETVQEYLARWFPQMLAQRSLRPTSVARYRADMSHIIRLIGTKPLTSVTPMDVQDVYTRLLSDGKAPATVRHVRVILHGAFQDALTWDLLAKDPLRGTKPPKVQRRSFELPPVEQARAFLRAAEADRLFALWAFLALTGCRRGEALALKWTDIDRERRTCVIQRTQSGWGAGRVEAEPKTLAAARVVALTDYLLEVLARQRDEQKLARLAAGLRWKEGGWVFTTRNGTWFAGGHVYDYFKQLVKEAGLPATLRPHDLRHAMASYWIAEGINPNVVSERLGHSDIAITLGTYGHLSPHMQAEAADKMDAWILGKAPPSATRQPHEPQKSRGSKKTKRTP